MKKKSIAYTALIVFSLLCVQAVSAQFNIKLPKIGKPKTEAPKADQPQSTANDPAPGKASTATEPSIAKDFVQVTPFTYSSYQKNYDIWSWVPMMSFRINGPVGSGDQLYGEFNVPGTGVVKFDCRTAEREAGNWDDVTCGGRDTVPEEKASKYTGVVPFSIKIRNELAGKDVTLFTGKAKIGKYHSNEAQTPKFVNHFVYYADHDWNMPIGYVLYREDERNGMKKPILNIAFWIRGDAYNFDPHLFYQGKEVGKMYYANQEVGKASCESETDNFTTNYVADDVPQKAKWSRVICTFGNVRGWNKTGEEPGIAGPPYYLSKNPGEYEFKLLWNNKLARSIKFTVKPDGTFDNGIAAANKLNSERTIVPVQIIGDQDGPWDRAAWKTDAFYGKPAHRIYSPTLDRNMDEYLFFGERVIVRKGANFLVSLEEHKLPRMGLLGADSEMNLVGLPQGSESIGGWLYLTNFRLFFRSHSVNRFAGTFSIFLPNVLETRDVSRSLSKMLEVHTSDHFYGFVVWGIPKLMSAIGAARDSLTDEQIKSLKFAAKDAPERCGDGLQLEPPVMDSLR